MNLSAGQVRLIFAGMCAGLWLLSAIATANEVVLQPKAQTEHNVVVAPVTAESNSASIENTAAQTSASSPVNTAKPLSTKSSTASQLASLVGGLALILALIYGLSWFVKRFSQGGFMHNPTLKIISALPLGTRERLMLVDVGGKQLLLGVTATQINTLHVFDEPVVTDTKTVPANSEFSQKLMAILQQKNISPESGAHKNTKS